MARTVARIDMEIQNNATWQDAFRFGDADDTTWNLVGEHFIMEVKGTRDDPNPLLTLSTDDGRIVVDDTTLRVIHLQVDDADIQGALAIGCYVYDLVMYNNAAPPRRVVMMGGSVKVCQGVTED